MSLNPPSKEGGQQSENLITIITKSEIRYEGILYNINPQDQSITLRNVRSFGTEGRRPADEIGPSQQTHDYIVFRGADIKDLKVIESDQQVAPQKVSSNVSIEKANSTPSTETQQTVQSSQTEEKPKQQQQQQYQQPRSNQHHQNQQSGYKTEYHPKNKEPEISKEDFDYESTNAKFTNEYKKDEGKNFYKQDDFFDSLSSSTVEKDQPLPRSEQKKIDQDTFGTSYVDRGNRGNRRGNRGGYNRGGNRGGRGGNRGGHHKNYNNQNQNDGGDHGGEYRVYQKKF